MKTFDRNAALNRAYEYMDMGMEPTSSIKQAGVDFGLEFGEEMGEFVNWALAQL